MHWALRLPADYSKFPDLTEQVHSQLERMYALVEKNPCRAISWCYW